MSSKQNVNEPLPASDLFAGWSDAECRALLSEVMADEKGRCCRVRMKTRDVSGPVEVCVSRYSHHESADFESCEDGLAWINKRWAELVESMRPANDQVSNSHPDKTL